MAFRTSKGAVVNSIRGRQVAAAAGKILCHNSLRVTWCKNCEEIVGLRLGADGPAQWCPIDDGCAYCGDNASVDMSIGDFLSGIRRPDASFTPWTSGRRPVSSEKQVEVRLGEGWLERGAAGEFVWGACPNPITAYRVIG